MEDVNGVATSIMILGTDFGRRIVAQAHGLDALIVDRDGTTWMTDGLRERLRPPPTRAAEAMRP